MSFFKSNNPTLSENKFQAIPVDAYSNAPAMTVNGTLGKFGFMMIMVLGAAYATWHQVAQGGNPKTLMIAGALGGFITGIVIVFKPMWARYLAPLYAILEGLFLGGVSATYNYAFQSVAPNLILQAVLLTIGVALAVFFLYRFQIIKATNTFKRVIISATMGIAIFYVIAIVLGLFGVQIGFLHQGSALGIGFSLFVVAIAALNLVLDFDMIEQGVQNHAPKYMEWYGAFALTVTIVWLYLEILRLLSKIAKR